MIEMEKMQTQSPCFARLTRSPDQPLVKTESPQPDKSTSSALARRPKVPSPSGYLGSWEELNKFIEDNELRFWVEEARITQNLRQNKNKNGVDRQVPAHFARLIQKYKESVNHIVLHENLDQGQILKVLYYNIASVSQGVIPADWAHRSLEVNYFLTEQLDLLRAFLGKEIVFYYENIRRNTREDAEKASLTRNFVETFQNIISPLLQPRFGVRIVFQTCQLLYDLMLEQKYFQVAKNKIELSLHRLLQETLLQTGTHPFVLLYFWSKEPRLLMDQDFPADGFLFRTSSGFKNLPQSTGRLKSLFNSTHSPRRFSSYDIFHWNKYDSFDPKLLLTFGSGAKYEEYQPAVGPREYLLEYLKKNLEINNADSYASALGTSKDYFLYRLEGGGPWSAILSSHASALSLFLLKAASLERLFQFEFRFSQDNSAQDYEFLQYVTSRSNYRVPSERREPSRTRRLMLRFSRFFTHSFSHLRFGSLENQRLDPPQVEQGFSNLDASKIIYKTPPLPELRTATSQDIFDVKDISSILEVQKLGIVYKQLAQEIESIYGWVMDVDFGVGNVIDYNRGWPKIASMINPNHLDEMIERLRHDLSLLMSIQDRMTNFSEDSQEQEASSVKAINTINKIFSQSNVFNLIQFTELFLEDLEVIRHAMKVYHPSELVPVNSDNLIVSEELSRVSQHLRELPSLLQRPSISSSSARPVDQ